MLSLADYRRKRIQESIQKSQSFSETFDKYFDLMKSELLSTFKYPEVLIESNQDEDFQKLIQYVYKLTKLEDYHIGHEIIEFYVNDCYDLCSSIIEEASADIDAGDPVSMVQNRVSQQIKTVFDQIKQLVTKAIDDNRQETPPVAPQDNSSQELPPVTINGKSPQTQSAPQLSEPEQIMGQGNMGQNQGQGQGQGKIGVPDRRGFWGWLKNLFSPTSWKNYFKSREGVARMRDMLAHDKKLANWVNQQWQQNFQYEAFIPAFNHLVIENNAQLVDISNILDQLGSQLSQFINIEIDKFAKQSSASNSSKQTGPVQTASAIDAANKQTTAPSVQNNAPVAPPSTNSPVVTAPEEKPVTPKQIDVEPSVPAQSIAQNPNEPAYKSKTREEVVASVPKAIKTKLENNKLSTKSIKKSIGNVYHLDDDGKIESTSGRREILALAKILGYKNSNGDSLPRSTRNVPTEEWNKIADYVISGLNHLGFISNTNTPVVASDADIAAGNQPIAAPEEKPVVTAPETKPVEAPVSSNDGSWKEYDNDEYHNAQSKKESIAIFKELKKSGVPVDDIYKLMNYYWDKNNLNTWNVSKDLEPLLKIYSPVVATPEEKPVVTAPEEKPVVTAPEEKPVVTAPEEKPVVTAPEEKPVVTAPEEKPVVTAPEEKPVEEPEDTHDYYDPHDAKNQIYSVLKPYLNEKYTPSFDIKHIYEFLNKIDLTPWKLNNLKEKDLENALEKLATLFAEYQSKKGVEIQKKSKKTEQPEPDQKKKEEEEWKRFFGKGKVKEKEDDSSWEDDYEDDEEDEDDDDSPTYGRSFGKR